MGKMREKPDMPLTPVELFRRGIEMTREIRGRIEETRAYYLGRSSREPAQPLSEVFEPMRGPILKYFIETIRIITKTQFIERFCRTAAFHEFQRSRMSSSQANSKESSERSRANTIGRDRGSRKRTDWFRRFYQRLLQSFLLSLRPRDKSSSPSTRATPTGWTSSARERRNAAIRSLPSSCSSPTRSICKMCITLATGHIDQSGMDTRMLSDCIGGATATKAVSGLGSRPIG